MLGIYYTSFFGYNGVTSDPTDGLEPNCARSSIDINRLVQERRNSSALAMELRLSCTNPSIWTCVILSTTFEYYQRHRMGHR